jgi:hypothetical protein
VNLLSYEIMLFVGLRSGEHLLTGTYACSPGRTPPGGVGSHMRQRLSILIEKFKYEKDFKIKINPIRLFIAFIFYPIKPSASLFILIKSHETIPLSIASLSFKVQIFFKKDGMRSCLKIDIWER